jgi:trimethylamine--corrinoid protein Co-methyltransferase
MTAQRSTRRGRRGLRRTDAAPEAVASTDAVGGRYAPLGDRDVGRILDAAVAVLEGIGLSEAPPSVVDLVTAAGGRMTDDGRLLFPRALVERAVDGARGPVALYGRAPVHDLVVGGDRVYTGTGGAAPFVVDGGTGVYRPSTLRDLYDAARLCDTLRHVHFVSRPLVAGDMETARDLDLNTAFACLAGTAKHVMVSASHPDHVAAIAAMCSAVAGSEQAFRERPFLSLNVNHAVPPLRLDGASCDVMIAAARAGIPVLANVFGQVGASSPVTVAGSVAQTMAEALAGVVIARLAASDARVVCGPRPMVVDLRTGAMTGGGGEQAQANAVAVQAMRRLGLAGSVIAGATDSKVPDAQAGFEKALSVTLAVQSGANLVTQACGMHAGLMAASFESYVIDNDMLGAVLRSAVPPVVDDETLALDAVAEVVRGEGHFLGRPETYARMKTDFLYPEIADRRSHEVWAEASDRDLTQRARDRVRCVLDSHRPDHLDAGLRRRLRAEFDLKLEDAAGGPS